MPDDETISTAPPTDAPKAPAPAPVKKEQPAKGPSTRGGRYYQRGGGNKSAPRDDAPPAEEAATGEGVRFAEGRREWRWLGRGRFELKIKHIAERGRGRGRGGRGEHRGEYRGDGRGRGRGGRPDRHSMTGRTLSGCHRIPECQLTSN
jgi:plasminogen activator inhibitor 1 RNA-binding protein